MGRYYLDLSTGDGRHIDEAGVVADTRADLSRKIRRLLIDIAQDEPLDDRSIISVQVRDEAGKPACVAVLILHSHWIE